MVDPFCGTGVTLIEALTNDRQSFGMDIDPLAVFISSETCSYPFENEEYNDTLLELEKKMSIQTTRIGNLNQKELEDYQIETWFPCNIALPSNSDVRLVEDLFTKDNLVLISYLLDLIKSVENTNIRNSLLLAFSATLARASKMYMFTKSEKSIGGNASIFVVYRYWLPKTPTYRNAWDVFKVRAKLVRNIKIKGEGIIGRNASRGDFKVVNDSAENLLKYIKKESVDYIFTDPPYGAHIAYLDLSTMWHAWLGFEVPESLRAREAIVGGELQFDEKHYLDVLQNSFEQMFFALKDNAWLSLVFHHKDHNLWYSIRDMMKYIGFDYVNTIAQPLTKQTFHKVKNPLRVLGECLIVNFQKSAKRRITVPLSLPLANILKNTAERVIYRTGGATIEEIMRDVVPELFENEMFIDASSKKIGDIISILESDFDCDENNLWQIRSERKIGNFIPPRVRIQYYVIGYLRKHRCARFDDIVTTILPLLVDGHRPTADDIAEVLKEICLSSDGFTWELKDPKTLASQIGIPFEAVGVDTQIVEVPDSTIHNQHIYRLAILCRKCGYVPFIGKRERIDPMFNGLKPLTHLRIEADESDLRRIEQIDIIWADQEAKPVWAFEIEEHTTILSALERFTALLKVAPMLGKDKHLTIIAPKSRRKKLFYELQTSAYIGHPLYLENKLTYMFNEDLMARFGQLVKRGILKMIDVEGICIVPHTDK